jgi:tight adherence protein B
MIAIVIIAIAMVGIGACLLVQGIGGPRKERIARQLAAVGRDLGPAVPDQDSLARSSRIPIPLALLRRRLLLADLQIGAQQLVLPGIACVVATAAAILLLDLRAACILMATIAGSAALYANARATRNRRRFLELLPSFIERLHQLLAAGSSLVTAFDKALDYSEPLVRAYLRPVAVRLAHGATLAEALNLQGLRLGMPQLTMLSVVAHASQRFGGSLGEVLSHVVTTLNYRLQVQREFDAMTAEIRASANVLIALPIVVAGVVFLFNPGYLAFFSEDPLGQIMIGFAAAFAAMGVVAMRLMTRIED